MTTTMDLWNKDATQPNTYIPEKHQEQTRNTPKAIIDEQKAIHHGIATPIIKKLDKGITTALYYFSTKTICAPLC